MCIPLTTIKETTNNDRVMDYHGRDCSIPAHRDMYSIHLSVIPFCL